ncbi:MAG: 30S ribosomal protein S6 [bacterium]|nr:30S ribosomal protein S6 [bacterium]
MYHYELLAIIPAQFTESEAQGIEGRVSEALSAQGISVTKTESLGKIKFAYPVNHVRHGYYRRFVFSTEPETITTLEKPLRLIDGLLRFSIVRTSEGASKKDYQLTAYQEPIVDRDDMRSRSPRQTAPVQRPAAPAAAPMTEKEVDAQIDKILEEKVL